MDARELLRQAGWSPGRRVDVDSMLAELASEGHVLVPPVRGFLREFSGLTIVSEDGRKTVQIDGHDAARDAGGIATIDLDPARFESLERLDRDLDLRKALARMFSLALGGVSMVSKK
jgi:hypothetical protein